ncbi:TetR/AcrR family transcriptional regulator [Agromyces bauzanensis]|uniref:TetR family transcriptional regulator n=1 Tax=Agromyces bauzanensis TaxID=1308924 RepID=A0A917UT10_9MICO|nr:TetR/AcrR family transcriptional regulator [Agromyces bauzanensis]GGJ83304.1 TetR family transcriptional regulator [Agromyces bauzanensis]
MSKDPSPRTPQRTAARREEILEAARELFNARGTAAVSTNHIAAAAGVSPGNLYYWFPDKRAVIRALFEEWSRSSGPSIPESDDPGATLRAFFAGVVAQPAVSARYAFFSRELVALLHADPELAAVYRSAFEVKTAAHSAVLASLAAAGLLHNAVGSVDLRDAVVAAWIASEAAPAFLDVVEPEAGPVRARAVSTVLLRALLTEAGERQLEHPNRHRLTVER